MTKCNIIFQLICFVTLLINVWICKGELFSAVSDLEPLLVTHKIIMDNLELYIDKEQKRINRVMGYYERFNREQEKLKDPDYLGNPIHAFRLFKRMIFDLDFAEMEINRVTEFVKNTTLTFPSQEDLIGAAQALIRLKDTFQLTVEDLVNGNLKGIYGNPMSSDDCYAVAQALYKTKDFKNGIVWMKEAFNKYSRENSDLYSFTKEGIAELIGYGFNSIGDYRNALIWIKKLLYLRPGDARFTSHFKSIDYFEDLINREELEDRRRVKSGRLKSEKASLTIYEKAKNIYDSLCRDEYDIPQEVAKRLKCRFLTESHPFLKLAPIKMEQLYIKPDIFMFHEVLNDHEIEHLKKLAKPNIKRAYVRDSSTGQTGPALYRINKLAWLGDNRSDIVASVTRRVAQLTGLSVDTAEELQVANYGIGGQYETHFDFSRNMSSPCWEHGNRIATVLFYLSEVTMGGATVFSKLGLSVSPVKGAALFWINLHPSGEGNTATSHGACPVLHGSKWIANKWLHQAGQEFIKQCDLEYQKEGILYKIHRPIKKK